ncbi:capsid protein precursor [Roe deer astrovirus]|nr:capsid protein precursor [Roe deer astrovirus]
MASRKQQSRRATRNTTNIVVRNGAAANQAGAVGGQRRRRNRNNKAPQVNVRVLSSQAKGFRRGARRSGLNNRVVFQKINTTLGTVGSNGSEQIECELACLMNPATMKEATGSNSFGPLGIYASTYSLFRMTRCNVILKPLVGDSAVSGTVTRVSWNPTSTPTQTSWSALGARKHVDVTPGKTGRFTLTARDLVGPKGGWYKTNTKGDPMMSFAGTLEVHTIGKTMSTYKNEAFTGGLFLAELETHWQFKDYAQQPGMLNLVKGEDTQQAQLKTDANGKLQLVVQNTSRMARAAGGGTSEIIWLVTDTVINVGSIAIPPPFGWLIRGGWWLIKRAAGAPVRAGEVEFDVYASISDARADMPCISTTPNSEAINLGSLHFQQVTPGNTGIGSDVNSRAIGSQPVIKPSVIAVTGAAQYKFPSNNNDMVPAVCKWYNSPAATTQVSTNGIGFKLDNNRYATHNMMRVEVAVGGETVVLPDFEHSIPIYGLYSGGEQQIGYAVAAQYDLHQESPALRVSSVLFYATSNWAYNFAGSWQTATVNYPVAITANNYAASVTVPTSNVTGQVRNAVEAGNWYIAQFVTIGVIDRVLQVGDVPVVNFAVGTYPTGTTNFIPSVTDAISGLLPTYATGFHLVPFTSSEITEQQYLATMEQQFYDASDSADEEEDVTDEDLELGLLDHYSDPPMSRLVVHPDAQEAFATLRTLYSEREARLAVNQLKPSDEYKEFTTLYHDAIVDGLSPRAARAFALGL